MENDDFRHVMRRQSKKPLSLVGKVEGKWTGGRQDNLSKQLQGTG